MKEYYLVPTMGSVFEVTPDRCFRQVIFEGEELGVRYHRDDPIKGFNTWDLQCYSCNPKLEIIPVSQKFFTDKYAFVIAHNHYRYN